MIILNMGINLSITAKYTYIYDSLNSFKEAAETISSTETWKQAFTYDRYGNRNFDEAETTTLLKNCTESSLPVVCAADRKVFNPTANPSDNRLSSADGYVFDDVGNTTLDPQGRTFIYDAENKQVEVKGDLNQTIGKYWYDGDGKRIKKYVPATGETTVYVYDAVGKLIADYSTELAPDPKVSYTTADHLGSPRVLTDENGEIISRRDFHPFGEEISTTERTAGLGYAYDHVRRKFTGYERDSETDLDFAQARIYSKDLGRFTTVDPIFFQKEMLVDPQRFNLYGYVRNNPLKFIDPFGMKLRISLSGDPDQVMEDMRLLAGDLAEHLVFNPVKDKDGKIMYYDVSFNVTLKDIEGNEGAKLIFDLVKAPHTFLAQRGGVVERRSTGGKNKGKIESVDVNARGGGNVTRNRPGTQFEPVDSEVDSIIYYPDNVVFVNIGSGEDVQPIRTFIHEAAESFLLAQGIAYPTAHGHYTYTSGTGKRAKITNFDRDPRNAISREKAIADQLNLKGGATGSNREGSVIDLRKK